MDAGVRSSHFDRLSSRGPYGGNGSQGARLPDRRAPALGSHRPSQHTGGPAVRSPTAVFLHPPPPTLERGSLTARPALVRTVPGRLYLGHTFSPEACPHSLLYLTPLAWATTISGR